MHRIRIFRKTIICGIKRIYWTEIFFWINMHIITKYLISEVELFPREEQKTQKRFVRAIAYKFPIEQKVLTQFDECGASIETVVLLSKDML